MQANRINRNLGVNKVIPVCIVLFCGLILTSGPELRAQESVDLSSKPEPSAAIIQQDNSTPSASTSETTIDAPVIPAQPLTFGERVKIYELSYIHPENLIGPALGAGVGQWQRHAAGMGTRC